MLTPPVPGYLNINILRIASNGEIYLVSSLMVRVVKHLFVHMIEAL
jgi:hypothetical protein